jgi:hypothetical protein
MINDMMGMGGMHWGMMLIGVLVVLLLVLGIAALVKHFFQIQYGGRSERGECSTVGDMA